MIWLNAKNKLQKQTTSIASNHLEHPSATVRQMGEIYPEVQSENFFDETVTWFFQKRLKTFLIEKQLVVPS